MNVKELIELLSKEDPNMRVVVDGYECGYNEVDRVEPVRIKPNTKSYGWDGEFDHVYSEIKGEFEIALNIPR